MVPTFPTHKYMGSTQACGLIWQFSHLKKATLIRSSTQAHDLHGPLLWLPQHYSEAGPRHAAPSLHTLNCLTILNFNSQGQTFSGSFCSFYTEPLKHFSENYYRVQPPLSFAFYAVEFSLAWENAHSAFRTLHVDYCHRSLPSQAACADLSNFRQETF